MQNNVKDAIHDKWLNLKEKGLHVNIFWLLVSTICKK